MHPRIVGNALAAVAAFVGIAMLVPSAYALLTREDGAVFFALTAVLVVLVGGLTFLLTRATPSPYVSTQDVFLIVVLGWIWVGTLGTLPFVFSGSMGLAEAFFNSMAGFTTTGSATVSPDQLPPSLLLWRSLTQWAGGIGIVVLFVAVAPLVGLGAAQLYTAEAATPVVERLTPRIQDTAKVLTLVYLALTTGIAAALLAAGMGPFEAANHALSTVSTGGFSTREDSIAAFDSVWIEGVLVVGMVMSGTNFGLYYLATQGRWRRALGNREFLSYLGILAAATLLMTLSLYAFDYQQSPVLAFREALFQSVSHLTGTAYSTADWNSWDPFSKGLLMVMMAVGACAGSTSGGLKVIRAILLARNAAQDVFKMIHPRAVTPLKLGDRVVPERSRTAFMGFFFVYVATLAIGTLLMALHQVPLGDAFGSVFACLNITGTAVGAAGSTDFYAGLPPSAQVTLTALMLLGRLELFTVLVLLTPTFWRG